MYKCTHSEDIITGTRDILQSPGDKTIKKNSIKNKSQTHCARAYEVTSFLSTDCELSTETRSKNVYSLAQGQTTGGDKNR